MRENAIRLHRLLPLICTPLFFIAGEVILALAQAPVSYHQQIRPILQRSCQGCHQPSDPNGELILTSYEALRKGGSGGVALIPGSPDESLMIELISGDPPAMPQRGDPLTVEDVDLFRRWIAEGAVDDTPTPADAINPSEPPVYTVPPVVTALAYSPDGEILAVSGYREILLHKSDGSVLVGRLVGKSQRVESITFGSDGKALAAVGGSPAQFGEAQFWEVSTNTLMRSVETTYDTLYGLSFSPDGKRVAFGCADKTVRVLSTIDGKELIKFDNHSDWVFGTLFSTDGSHFVSGGRDGALKLVEINTGNFVDDINASNKGYGGINAIARHPHDDQVLAGGTDRIPRLYRIFREIRRDVGNTDFNLIRAFEAQAGPITSVDFSPDGKKIAVGGMSAEIRVYDVADGERLATLKGDTVAVYSLAFHPNGDQIAAGGFDGKVRIFDVVTGKLSKEFLPVPIRSDLSHSGGEAWQEITLAVTGMSCDACVSKVKGALAGLSGVIRADVSLSDNRATVSVQKGNITVADLVAAVKGVGFTAAVSKEE